MCTLALYYSNTLRVQLKYTSEYKTNLKHTGGEGCVCLNCGFESFQATLRHELIVAFAIEKNSSLLVVLDKVYDIFNFYQLLTDIATVPFGQFSDGSSHPFGGVRVTGVVAEFKDFSITLLAEYLQKRWRPRQRREERGERKEESEK